MKRLLIILLCVASFVLMRAQYIVDLQSGKMDKDGTSTVPRRDVEKIPDGYIITYTFDKAMVLQDDLFSGTVFWKMDGFGINQTPGEPSTLFRNDLIAVPTGYKAQIEVTDCKYRDYKYELTPARKPLLNNSNEVYTKKSVVSIQPYEDFKPASIAALTGFYTYRGYKMCQATLCPIQYNYGTKTVRAYTSITYKVLFVPNSTEDITKEPEKKALSCEDHFLANNVIGIDEPEADLTSANPSAQLSIRDYLILSTSTYSSAAQRIANWKRLLGFNVLVIIHDNWTTETVKNVVLSAYANNPHLYYLLIIGDQNDVPSKLYSSQTTHYSDYYYACMDNDYVPDIYCGRLSVSTSTEAINVVDKIIGYERNPPTNSSFYSNGLNCAYFQDTNLDSYADRRFAQTSEDVRSYLISHGKSIQRVYTTESFVNPLYWNNFLYSYGEPIPNELIKPGFAWNGNSTNITNAINSGVFYVLHRDHGSVTGWGDPQYTQNDIGNLSNGNLLPIVFSMNCETGKFDEYCFAETFLRKINGGCVAIYGASQTSYSGYNDALTTGMFDAIWPNPGLSIHIPNKNNSFSTTPSPSYTLGQILAQGMVRMTETYGSDDLVNYTKEIFHCFGDPSMKIYTEQPIEFDTVLVNRNSNSISVNLGVGDTARITAYDPVTGIVLSYIGNSVIIPISNPDDVIICVSAHNRIPYIEQPDILYIQNTNITGTLDEIHDVIKVGNHVTTTIDTGNVTTTNADISLRARKIVLDRGTSISVGTTLQTHNQ